MNRKLTTKLFSALLAFLICFSDIAFLGSSYAVSNLEEQSTNVSKSKIEFDAYFKEGEEEIHTKNLDVDKEEILYLHLSVKEGYLKNSSIKIENANFKIENNNEELDTIQSISEEENKIILNQINKDESVTLSIPIKINADSNLNVKDLSKEALITLEGTYVNDKAKDVKISKTIKVKTSIDGEAKSSLEGEVTKYVKYDVNGDKGVILETSIKSTLVDNKLPTKSTVIEIEIPKINNIMPKEISVSISGLATNGEARKVFNEDEYEYKDGKVIIKLENNKENLYWLKNVEDEIILTCIYEEQAILEKVELNLKANSNIKYYAKEEREISNSLNKTIELTEAIGDIVTLEYEAKEEMLYKGNMMAKNGKNTEINTQVTANISYSKLIDKIVLNESANYKDENGRAYSSNMMNVSSKISKDNLVQILGEDGYINIIDRNGEKIATLNKENEEYKYNGEMYGVTFETSKPIAEGTLEIENKKEIKPLEYELAKEEIFSSLVLSLTTKAISSEKEIVTKISETEIKLENPILDAKLEIDKPNFSTVQTNENVELRVTLNTKDLNTKLYTNPIIEIVLPKYIEEVKINNSKLLYDEELKIVKKEIYTNGNGNKVIRVAISGTQTKYNESHISDGATLIINANIDVDKFTPTRKEKVSLNIKNGIENVIREQNIKIVAPAGIEAISQIEGYSDNGEKVSSMSSAVGVGKIKARSNARIATIKIAAINNYEVDCKNTIILGRIPFEGNRSITKNKELGSTFGAKLVSNIKSETGLTGSQMKVYYSENGEADYDLNNVDNGWTDNLSFATNAKSYMIVLNDYTFKSGEVLAFSYNIEIPAMLGNNEATFGIFAIYYEKELANAQEGMKKARMAVSTKEAQVKEATAIGAATNTEANLEVVLESDSDGKTLHDFDLIKYTVKVKNNGLDDVDNVKVELPISENMFYTEYNPESRNYDVIYNHTSQETHKIETIIEKIKPNETKDVVIALRIVNISDDSSKEEEIITTQAKVTADEKDFVSNTKSNTIKYLDFSKPQIKEIKISPKSKESVIEGNKVQYKLEIIPWNTLENVKVSMVLPNEVSFIAENNKDAKYDEKTRTITWEYSKVLNQTITLTLDVNKLPDNVTEKQTKLNFSVIHDGIEEAVTSNTLEVKIIKFPFSANITSNKSSDKLDVGEEIIYSITVKNTGEDEARIQIKDVLPDELEVVSYSYTNGDGVLKEITEVPYQTVNLQYFLGKEKTFVLNIRAKVIANNEKKEITNKAEVILPTLEVIETNSISHKISGQKGEEIDPPKPEEETKYTITGTAWLDANKDGIRDDKEELLPRIKVYLLNTRTNRIVKNAETNEIGTYTFADVEKGIYVVAFEYDTNKYALTTYHADNADESKNSDVIKLGITIDGKLQNYAVTDTISLNSNQYNIDMGLIDEPKFDLELSKEISLVQTSNKEGTKTYTFNNKLAKVEIPEKYMKGTAVSITYKFTVKNTGAVSGYVNKLVDYKAKDLEFNSSLNPEWYEENGDLYTTSLEGKEIKPGETLEASLILTKMMTAENTGITNNSAELAEVSNDLGLDDIDSIPSNKNTNDDDYSTADIIITVKTGGIIFYGMLSLVILGLFALRSL